MSIYFRIKCSLSTGRTIYLVLLNNGHSETEKILDIIQYSNISLPVRNRHNEINQLTKVTNIPIAELGQSPSDLQSQHSFGVGVCDMPHKK